MVVEGRSGRWSSARLLLLRRRTASISERVCCYTAVGIAVKRGFPRQWRGSRLFFAVFNSDISKPRFALARLREAAGAPSRSSDRHGGTSTAARLLIG